MLISSGLTAVAALFMVVMAVGSAATNRSTLGIGIGAVLLLWAAVLAAGAVGLAKLRRWARGPVVAGGLLHLVSFANFVPSQPWAVVGVVVAGVTVAAAVTPSTTKALRFTEGEPD